MYDEKAWYQSTTIKAAIVTIIALMAGAFNLNIDLQTQGDIVSLFTIIVGAIGSVVTIWGRIKASKTIK